MRILPPPEISSLPPCIAFACRHFPRSPFERNLKPFPDPLQTMAQSGLQARQLPMLTESRVADYFAVQPTRSTQHPDRTSPSPLLWHASRPTGRPVESLRSDVPHRLPRGPAIGHDDQCRQPQHTVHVETQCQHVPTATIPNTKTTPAIEAPITASPSHPRCCPS